MTSKKFLVLTIAALLGTVFLLGLGTWQLQRMHWKAALLAKLETRAVAEPVALAVAREMFTRSGDDVRFLRVNARGRYRHDAEMHLYGIWQKQPGWRVITPLETVAGETLLVIRGFVPDAMKRAETRRDGQPDGEVDLVGRLRFAEAPGTFIPDNDTAANQWYWRDLAAMQKAADTVNGSSSIPFFLELESAAHPAQWPQPAPVSAASLHNRHLGYALTWFGLAGALLCVYGLMFRARRKAAKLEDGSGCG